MKLGADYGEVEARAAELLSQCDALMKAAPSVASARAVLSFSSDRLKRALALAVNDALAAGATSFAQAESKARASTAYRDALDNLAAEDEMAEGHVAHWHALNCKIDALRSIVALERQKVQIL